jgi:hypothetical protein
MKIHLSFTILNMKKILLFATALSITLFSFGQETPTTKKKTYDLRNRANDHFMIQFGVASWLDKPDSIGKKGLSRSFNFYVMLDFPFKTNPKFSVAFGPGVGTDHIFLDKQIVSIADHTGNIRFENKKDTNHFKKYKLTSAFLELPVELRFSSRPDQPGRSVKVAIGLKVGTLIDIHTKGKNWVNKDGNTIAGFSDKYVKKEKDKFFFNGNRFVATARLGWGHWSLFGNYQLGTLIKEGLGPQVRPISIGLTLSGL